MINDCALEQVTGGRWWCPRCDPAGHRLLPVNARRNCREPVDISGILSQIPPEHAEIRESVESAIAAPDFLKRGGHWVEALAKWAKAGYPTRPLDIRRQLHVICHGCPSELYDPDKKICKVCGCNVRASFLPVLDKAALGTEDCPKGHWGEINAG